MSRARDLRDAHEERHRPSGFGFALADSVDYLDADRWDLLTKRDSIFLSRRYLRVLEDAAPDNLQQRYALIFRVQQGNSGVRPSILRFSGNNSGSEQGNSGVRPSILRFSKLRLSKDVLKPSDTRISEERLLSRENRRIEGLTPILERDPGAIAFPRESQNRRPDPRSPPILCTARIAESKA